MGFFTKKRDDGVTFDGQGQERVGIIDNVFYTTPRYIYGTDIVVSTHVFDAILKSLPKSHVF